MPVTRSPKPASVPSSGAKTAKADDDSDASAQAIMERIERIERSHKALLQKIEQFERARDEENLNARLEKIEQRQEAAATTLAQVASSDRLMKSQSQVLADLKAQVDRMGFSQPKIEDRVPVAPNMEMQNTKFPQIQYDNSLKATTLGLFNPKDASFTVRAFVDRLRWLASIYGEQAVLENMIEALQPVASWTNILMGDDLAARRTLEGWIGLLNRDFAPTPMEAMRRLQAMKCFHSDSSDAYVDHMLALLADAKQTDVEFQIEMIIDALPSKWVSVLNGHWPHSISGLRRTLRRLEDKEGWPTGPASSTNKCQ